MRYDDGAKAGAGNHEALASEQRVRTLSDAELEEIGGGLTHCNPDFVVHPPGGGSICLDPEYLLRDVTVGG